MTSDEERARRLMEDATRPDETGDETREQEPRVWVSGDHRRTQVHVWSTAECTIHFACPPGHEEWTGLRPAPEDAVEYVRPVSTPGGVAPKLIGPMSRRIGLLSITLRRLIEAVDSDSGQDMTPLWDRAREVLADTTISAVYEPCGHCGGPGCDDCADTGLNRVEHLVGDVVRLRQRLDEEIERGLAAAPSPVRAEPVAEVETGAQLGNMIHMILEDALPDGCPNTSEGSLCDDLVTAIRELSRPGQDGREDASQSMEAPTPQWVKDAWEKERRNRAAAEADHVREVLKRATMPPPVTPVEDRRESPRCAWCDERPATDTRAERPICAECGDRWDWEAAGAGQCGEETRESNVCLCGHRRDLHRSSRGGRCAYSWRRSGTSCGGCTGT